jgi:hypothetical protein
MTDLGGGRLFNNWGGGGVRRIMYVGCKKCGQSEPQTGEGELTRSTPDIKTRIYIYKYVEFNLRLFRTSSTFLTSYAPRHYDCNNKTA